MFNCLMGHVHLDDHEASQIQNMKTVYAVFPKVQFLPHSHSLGEWPQRPQVAQDRKLCFQIFLTPHFHSPHALNPVMKMYHMPFKNMYCIFSIII